MNECHQSVAPEVTPPNVCPPQEVVVTLCLFCKVNPAKKKFCSPACRQGAYRQSAAYDALKVKGRKIRLLRRNRWCEARFRDKHLTFDGLWGGSINRAVPKLGQFEKPNPKLKEAERQQ